MAQRYRHNIVDGVQILAHTDSGISGPIEKGANDGQIDYVKSLVAALNAAVASKPSPSKAPAGRKGKRKGKKEPMDVDAPSVQREIAVVAEKQKSNWGPLEPVHALLDPILALFRPFITSQVVIAVLFVLLTYNWFASPRSGRGSSELGYPRGVSDPVRLAAYEEIWRREESRLWDWLEDRVGLEGGYAPAFDGGGGRDKQKVLAARNMGKKLEDERMTERQMDDAIRVTSERLETLKDAVAKKKSGK